MVRKLLRWQYYCTTMLKQVATFVHACKPCQKYAPQIAWPFAELVSIPSAWSFAQWGIDLLGPLPWLIRQQKWIIVGINYFSKSVEAKALASTIEIQVIKFLKSQVISWYGVPHVLISDNGPQFVCIDLKCFLEELCIEHQWGMHGQMDRLRIQ